MARSRPWTFLAGFGLALALVACTAAVDIQTVCLPLRTYSPAEQAQLKAEYDALAAKAFLRTVIQDYLAMRDADKACLKNS